MHQKNHVATLNTLGQSWIISDDELEALEYFTCAVYGRTKQASMVNDLRLIHINEICAKENSQIPSSNVDMGSLPPCKRSLKQHIQRVNYQVGIWRRAHIPNPTIPKASPAHGWKMEDGILQPIWYEGEILPKELVDIVQDTQDDSDSNTESDVDEFLDVEQESLAYYSDDSDNECEHEI